MRLRIRYDNDPPRWRPVEPVRLAGDNHLVCVCHLRKATRTFRFDRVLEVIDQETGEVMTGPQFKEFIHDLRNVGRRDHNNHDVQAQS